MPFHNVLFSQSRFVVIINRRHLEVARNYSHITRSAHSVYVVYWVAIPKIEWKHISNDARLQFIQIWREFYWNISPLRVWLLFSLARTSEASFPNRCVFIARTRVTTAAQYISMRRCIRMSPTATCPTAHGSHNIPCVSTDSRYSRVCHFIHEDVEWNKLIIQSCGSV